jgi:hypothetical protein
LELEQDTVFVARYEVMDATVDQMYDIEPRLIAVCTVIDPPAPSLEASLREDFLRQR